MRFSKELYGKTALIKAAYNFTDTAYIHLDADDRYYYVEIEAKDGNSSISEKEFINEMLAQCVRHEIYRQTKSIRELLLTRAVATSVIVDETAFFDDDLSHDEYRENDVLKDWFSEDEDT